MRILCIDDDSRTKAHYCEEYRLDPELIDYANNLNDALEYISNPNKRQQYDLVLLDVKIKGGIQEEYKQYLGKMVTEDKLQHIESGYGGFYLYLSLLYEGFPPNRIGFLSAYIDYQYHNLPRPSIQILEELKENIIEENQNSDHVLHKLKGMIDVSDFRALEKMVKAKAWSTADDKVSTLIAEVKSEEEHPEKGINHVSDEHINEHFDSFNGAGLKIEKNNKFSKAQNKIGLNGVNSNSNLLKWISEKDKNGYYNLRYGIIQGCQDWIEYLEKMTESNAANIEKIRAEYKGTGDKDNYIAAMKRELAQSTDFNSEILKFYRFKNSRENLEQTYYDGDISFRFNSNLIATRYGLEYFKNMLTTLRMLLPVREPANKNELYMQMVKMLTHPWEAAKASYKDSVYKREDLFNNCISTVAKSVRNWTAHSRLKEFTEEDVAFIFIILMRTYFHQNLSESKPYEHHLVKYVLHYDDSAQTQMAFKDITGKLTVSLKNLNYDNVHSVKDINVANLFTEIGKNKDCPPQYLYRMFAHVAHYPYVVFNEGLSIKFNPVDPKNEPKPNDLFSHLLSICMEKGF